MKLFILILFSLFFSASKPTLVKHKLQPSQVPLQKQEKKSMPLPAQRQLKQQKTLKPKIKTNKSELNSIEKKVVQNLKDSKKSKSFVVTREQINKISQKKIEERRLEQKDRKLAGGDAEDKIDSMPLLLFGDYDIIIEKK